VPELTRKHFEEAWRAARKSVTDVDLTKYENFKRKFDPNYAAVQTGVSKGGIPWRTAASSSGSRSGPVSRGGMFNRANPSANNDDDLYS
jgi:transitional endoplasmic reticulum ATPase